MDMTELALYLTVIWLTIHAYYNMKQRPWNLQKKKWVILAVLLPLEEKVKIRMLSNNYIKIKIQGWTSWDTLKRTRLCLPKLYYVGLGVFCTEDN